MKRNLKQNKTNFLVIGILAFFLVTSVGYALFSETLVVNGTANANGKFDVRFESTKIVEYNEIFHRDGPLAATVKISDDEKNFGKILTINVPQLDQPGSFVRVKAVIKNFGTIPVKLEKLFAADYIDPDKILEFTDGNTSEDINGILKNNPNIKIYFEEYDDSQKFTEMENKVLNQGDTQEIFIKIEWDPNSTEQSTDVQFTLGFTYRQVIAGEDINPDPEPTPDPEPEPSPDPEPEPSPDPEPKLDYKIGDHFCLNGDKECFYVIEDSDETKPTVTALAEYNLLVGQDCDSSNSTITCIPISSDTEGYGLQNENAKGYVAGENLRKGVMKFSDINYWYDGTNLKSEYGAGYPANVFDSNSKLYEYVKNYEYYLKSLGKASVAATLITKKQLVALGCDPIENVCIDSTTYPWVYSTAYWSASAYDEYNLKHVTTYGYFTAFRFEFDNSDGVRPVITIDKSEI